MLDQPPRPSTSFALLRGMRPKQWIKNVLLFAGFVYTLNEGWHPFTTEMWRAFGRSAAAFLLFSLVSSSVYLLNDVLDVEKDRKHPTKSKRPIASGALSPRTAVATAVVLMPVCLVASYLLSPPFAAVAAGYLAMQFGYIFA